MLKKHTLLSTLLGAAVCILVTASAAMAQPGGGGPIPGPGGATAVPIDGGISLLVAAGGAYGLKQLRDRRAKK